MPKPPTDSRLANAGARAIFRGFDAHQRAFLDITDRAKRRFEVRDWGGLQTDATARLDVYAQEQAAAVSAVRMLLGPREKDRSLWSAMKAVYSGLIAIRDDWDLAETFFNSVTRRIFSTVGVDQNIEFIDTDFDSPPTGPAGQVLRSYSLRGGWNRPLAQILADTAFAVRYAHPEDDLRLAIERMEHAVARTAAGRPDDLVILDSVLYRGRRAYLIGQIRCAHAKLPLALVLGHADQGVFVEAVLTTEDELSILFGFTRSYFIVHTRRPHDQVRFLSELMPRKLLAELYTALGFNKHGKTELYRHFLRHLDSHHDRFVPAPGTPGMVMLVFTLPSYEAVFKIIKDRFAAPKTTTRAMVQGKYNLVFRHDRAGRLLDAQEFEHLDFPQSRFSAPLLQQIADLASESASFVADRVILRHVYIERRVRPLDLYVTEEDENAVSAAVIDFGHALKDLARANFFPGDLLLKNFGVTRHGRVVAYDYDELRLLTDCRFVSAPIANDFIEPPSKESPPPGHTHDVLPAELRIWAELAEPHRQRFLDHHADLHGPAFWRAIQSRLLDGEIIDIPPFAPGACLRVQDSGKKAEFRRIQIGVSPTPV